MSAGVAPEPRVQVDREVCIGSGLCVHAAAEVFDQAEDDGLVTLLVAEPLDPNDPAVREAVRRCPSGALTLRS